MFENQHLLANDWKEEKNKMEGEFEEGEDEQNNENNIIINYDEDGFEELRDFQLLLMPAARQSAARRFNSNTSPVNANKINEQQKQQKNKKNCENAEKIGPIPPFVQRRQRNINNNNYILNHRPPAFLETTIKTSNKFPLIDEDLLMLISRNNNNNNNNKNIKNLNGTTTPSNNLCRLITNVSECKWTTPTTTNLLEETQNLEKIVKIEETPKKMANILPNNNSLLQNSSWNSFNLNNLNQNPPNKNLKKSKTYSSPISSNKNPKISKTSSSSSSHFNSVIVPSERENILFNQKKKELINDSSTNCDCTSLAFAAFRRRQIKNNNLKNEEEEDIYQKIESSSSSKSSKNLDSGISSSPCSSGGSIEGDKNNLLLLNSLPPPPLFEDNKNKVKEAVVLLSRRRQTLNYLLG
uniref:Uncharacterized protein n=1 Tax=Meloidogyne floridensis TaxID=298350 RepID=A0A915NWJ7_9BILA